jgi:hypothetical protein
MAKKDRTGLQSEISHIFAGVPMPRRKRRRSDTPEKKPKPQEPEQTQEEKPLVEETPVQKEQEKQPIQPEISEEKPPVEKSPVQKPPEEPPFLLEIAEEEISVEEHENVESSVPEATEEKEKAKETPFENLIAPPSQAEEIPIAQSPVVEPPVEEPSTPFEKAIEIPEPEEPIGITQELPSVKPVRRSVPEERDVKVARKARVSTKSKSITSKPSVKSRKQKTQIIFIIALSILLVYLLVNQFSKTSSNTRLVQNDSTLSQISLATDIESVAVNWEQPPVYPEAIRNPMVLGAGPDDYISFVPNLTGIVYTENLKNAIIGENILEEGEVIKGVKIVKINRDSVEFERDGRKWTQEVQSDR